MKWVLFVLSLFALFFANNMLFLVPGKRDGFTAVAVGIAISIAGVLAWFSSRKFAQSTSGDHVTWKNVMVAPPAVIWLFVSVLFCLVSLWNIAPY